ncbi:MAG: beta-ketoacyl reductase, partial [Planctomycetota bacterium]|nr:beta-ketoacyl reductase [Planctomycetota bacterium]
MVSGGLGELGVLIAAWLSGAAHESSLCLLGRSGRAPVGIAHLGPLMCSFGGVLRIVRSDISVCEESSLAFAHGGDLPLASAIFHASGVLRDAALANQTAGSGRASFSPKVLGGFNLIGSRIGMLPLSAAVHFSSIASALGSGGQSNYAAANEQLDRMSRRHRQTGVHSVSIQWGAWRGGGMASASVVARLERSGVGAIHPSDGMDALGALLRSSQDVHVSSVGVALVSPFDWRRFESRDGIFQSVRAEGATAVQSVHSGAGRKVLDRVSIEKIVRSSIAEIIGDSFSMQEPLMAAGIDSLSASELQHLLQSKTGMKVPATLIFDYPTGDEIAAF